MNSIKHFCKLLSLKMYSNLNKFSGLIYQSSSYVSLTA